MIYVLQGVESGRVKVGFSARSGMARLKEALTGSPEPLRLVWEGDGDEALEQQIHRELRLEQVRGAGSEWFYLTEHTRHVLRNYGVELSDHSYAEWASRERRSAEWRQLREDYLQRWQFSIRHKYDEIHELQKMLERIVRPVARACGREVPNEFRHGRNTSRTLMHLAEDVAERLEEWSRPIIEQRMAEEARRAAEIMEAYYAPQQAA